jgi:hypothetical protein
VREKKMDQQTKKKIDDALRAARGLAQEIAAADGEPSERLAGAASNAIELTDAAVKEADEADKQHKKLVAAQAGVVEGVGDVAASRISPFGPGSPEGLEDQKRAARTAVTTAMIADARDQVMAQRGAALQEKATASADACRALASAIEREELLSLGVGEALGQAPSAEEAAAEDRLVAELGAKSGADLVKLFTLIKEMGDEEKLSRFERAALRIATGRRSSVRSLPRPSPNELSELGAMDVLVAAVETSRRERMPESIGLARDVLAILKNEVFGPVFSFDARVASKKEMEEIRLRPSAFAAVTRPFALAPDIAARVMP